MIDVPVLLLFFARPEQTKRVFESIRRAQPKKLYLFQDGPRTDNVADEAGVAECRKLIESMIDWPCNVYRNYHKSNIGCDPSGYLSRKWIFETETKAIILEDDCVPDDSFFDFCQIMLEKYENDNRIQMICGYNPVGVYKCKDYDYIYSKVGSIWGWATWRRVVDGWDEHYSWMNSEEKMAFVLNNYPTKHERKQIKHAFEKHRESGVAYFETINAADMMLNNRVAINPCKNLISNCGISSINTHSADSIELLPLATRKLFNSETYTMPKEPKGPADIVPDIEYKRVVDKVMGNSGFAVFKKRCESTCFLLKHRGIKAVYNKIRTKVTIRQRKTTRKNTNKKQHIGSLNEKSNPPALLGRME